MIFDSGPLYASLDRDDVNHAACRGLIESLDEPLLVPSPVIGEVDYWIRKRLTAAAQEQFFADLESGAYEPIDLTRADYGRVRELCRSYYDSDLGFVDASILAVAERLGERRIATLDHRHFRMLRPRHVDALELLP